MLVQATMGSIFDVDPSARLAAWCEPHDADSGVVQALQQQVRAHGAIQPTTQQEMDRALPVKKLAGASLPTILS